MHATTEADAWTSLIRDLDEGRKVEMDEETYDYFLEILPPVFMGRTVTLIDGRQQRASFGFSEGAERIKAFWSEKDAQTGERRYYAQATTEINRPW